MGISAINVAKPILAAAIFFFLAVYFTPSFSCAAGNQFCAAAHSLVITQFPYHFNPAVQHVVAVGPYALTITPFEGYFVSSPFNMETEGTPLYNLVLPTFLIFLLGIYLKNFNTAFQKKCSLRAVFLMAIAASYVKSLGSMLYYRGYSDFGISLGTSIITLCFLAAFLISLEVYVEDKERLQHLYGHFMFVVLSSLILLLAVLVLFSFFSSSSFIVHSMGLTAFLIMFIPFYERANIAQFVRGENALAASPRQAASRAR